MMYMFYIRILVNFKLAIDEFMIEILVLAVLPKSKKIFLLIRVKSWLRPALFIYFSALMMSMVYLPTPHNNSVLSGEQQT